MFENFNFDTAGTTDPEFRMESVDDEAAAQRLLVEYGITPGGGAAEAPLPGATGEIQQQFPPGVAGAPSAGLPAVPPTQPTPPTITQPEEMQTVETERDELIRALQQGATP